MTRQRLRATVTLVLALALLGIYGAHWLQLDHRLIGGSDFSPTYAGAGLWREGHRADLYAEPLQFAAEARVNAPEPPSRLAFVNPPAAAVLAAPVTLFGLDAAYRLWTIAQFALLAAAVGLALAVAPWERGRGWLLPAAAAGAALAGVPTVQFLVLGQWGGLGALGVAAAYAAWRRGRPATGAALLALSAAAAKPHLALGLAAFLLGWRDRRALAGATAGVLAAVAVSLLAVGTAGFGAFLHAAAADTGHWPLRSLLGFTGLLGSWLGDAGLTHLLAALGTVLAMGACLWLGAAYRRRPDLLEPALAGAVALSLVASPHLRLHDLVLLAPVLVWSLAWAGRSHGGQARVAGLWLVLSLAAGLDLGNSRPAPPGRLIPWALLLAGAVAVSAVRGALQPGHRTPPAEAAS